MKNICWVSPQGGQRPPLGSRVPVQLAQIVNGRPLHDVGYATTYSYDKVCVELLDTPAGIEAAILLKNDLVDPVWWGSGPTLRLR